MASFSKLYFGFATVGLSVCNYFALLRGRGFHNRLSLMTLRAFIFSLGWLPAYQYSPILFSSLLLAYFPFFADLSEHHFGERFSSWFPAKLLAKKLTKYFNVTLVRTKEITENQCIIGLHPHAILPLGSVLSITSDDNQFPELFPTLKNRVLLAASSCFLVPVFREALISSKIRDCSRFNALEFLASKRTICIVPGGAHEGLYANPDIDWLDLKRKLGFIRLAVQTGVKLVPSYTFNEVDYWRQVEYDSIHWVVQHLRKLFVQKTFGISMPFLLNLLPICTSSELHLTTVIGEPIKLPYENVENPTQDQLEECMEIYITALRALYEKYSPLYNSRKRQLVVS